MEEHSVDEPAAPGAGGDGRDGARRWSFVAVNVGYLAVTSSESLLAPIFPVAAPELGLALRDAGFAFALLAAAIAVGNVAGGLLLTRRGPKVGASLGLIVTAAGAALAGTSRGVGGFLAAQALLGFGSGLFFASGLSAAGALGGDRRRGLAMGFFGVAFSGGLALAALLAALGAVLGWRFAFAAAVGLLLVATAGVLAARMPPQPVRPPRGSLRAARRLLGTPLAVGGMAAASQYGTISFLPTFAVASWGLAPSSAAILLAVARVLSVPAKLTAGHRADRLGALVTAGQLGLLLAVTGLWWTLAPSPLAAAAPAVVFAAAVSGLGPAANVLALEAFGHRGTLLGVWRSMQIAMGAAMSALIGVSSRVFGLRPTLAVAALVPVVLTALARRARRRG